MKFMGGVCTFLLLVVILSNMKLRGVVVRKQLSRGVKFTRIYQGQITFGFCTVNTVESKIEAE